ncbi:MAG: UrcA family protein [Novosphingobium sp.]|nr:UrcA family protein [Novosphingobium sp.]
MTRLLPFRRVALLCAIASMAATPAAAQDETPPTDGPEIVVEAPRPLPPPPETVGRSPYTGAPVVVATLRIPVLYGDLDLADPTDADRLMKRIERVSSDACAQLDRLYPLSSDTECVARTLAGARPAAQAVIDKALAAKTGQKAP